MSSAIFFLFPISSLFFCHFKVFFLSCKSFKHSKAKFMNIYLKDFAIYAYIYPSCFRHFYFYPFTIYSYTASHSILFNCMLRHFFPALSLFMFPLVCSNSALFLLSDFALVFFLFFHNSLLFFIFTFYIFSSIFTAPRLRAWMALQCCFYKQKMYSSLCTSSERISVAWEKKIVNGKMQTANGNGSNRIIIRITYEPFIYICMHVCTHKELPLERKLNG